jgi:hypothetical protein
MKLYWRVMSIVAGLALSAGAARAQDAQTLVSVKTEAAPAIDGKMSDAWAKAKPLNVELSKTPYEPKTYKGMKKTTVALRSLHDGDSVYFLLEWSDPTESLARFPWVKQPNGAWKMMKEPDETEHDNTYYEDKLAMFWNVNAQGFEQRGCAAVCHKSRDGKNSGFADKSPGRKYTNKAGETVDMWHWKSVRTGPVGQMDDQYVDDTRDPGKNADWGRKSNDSSGGGVSDNVTADKKGPAFMNKTPGAKYWVLDSDKTAFADTFKPGDVVGSVVVAPLTGPRANIAAVGRWANGKWTLTVKRKLVTAGANAKVQDVQFSDLKKAYPFGVAVFDNTQINHLYHEGAYKLMFK